MQLRNGKTIYRCGKISRYIRDKFYLQMRRLEGEELSISSKIYDYRFGDDDYVLRIPFFRSPIVYRNIDEYKKIVFLCIDVLLLKSWFESVLCCIQFRKHYYKYDDFVNKLRREYTVEFIFGRLNDVFNKSVALEKAMMGFRGSSYSAELFRKRFAGVSLVYPGYDSDMYSLLSSVGTIRNSVVSILFYKEIYMLKLLLFKFDYPIVECICKYYIGSDLFVDFAKLV